MTCLVQSSLRGFECFVIVIILNRCVLCRNIDAVKKKLCSKVKKSKTQRDSVKIDGTSKANRKALNAPLHRRIRDRVEGKIAYNQSK